MIRKILHIAVPAVCVLGAVSAAWHGEAGKGFLFIIAGLIYYALTIPPKPPANSNHINKNINLN